MSNEEFDFEKFNEEYFAELEADEIADEQTETPEDVTPEESEETPEGVVVDPVEETPEDEPDIHTSDEEKRNRAFADLRRERDEAAKVASFLKRIADENGTSVDAMMQEYEQSKLQQQAETQNVPVEVLQKLQKLEQENEQIRNQTFTERFNTQVAQTAEKYKASNEDLEKTFQYAGQNGLVDALKAGTMTFEAVYRVAHMDSIVEQQVQKAIQENLTNKKKRQQEAPLAHRSETPTTPESLEDKAVRDAKAIIEGGKW